MTTDRETVKKILDGDSQSFRLLVQDYQKLVAHVVFRMISNQADREEIAQEVFLKVYQNLSKFEFNSKLSTWIAAIAYNRCLNYLEKKKVPLLDDVTPEDMTIDDFSGINSLPDTKIMQQDVANRVHIALDQLPIKYKTVLTLFHLEQMRYDEIGEIMKVPEGTVKSYLFRGRKLLKDVLSVRYSKEELLS